MFDKDYEIKFYEVDYKNKLKETVLLNFLQDIASHHAEILGFGYSFIKPKKLGWFLLKYHLKIFKWPENIEKIIIKTWPRGIFRLFCEREFEVYTGDMEKIAVVSSAWALTDLTSKKIIQPASALNYFPTNEKKALETNFPKIPEVGTVNFEKVFEVRYDDIDINQHVNNAKYLEWALDTLEFDFRGTKQIDELEIQYKKELKFGSKVLSLLELSSDNTITTHTLKNTETKEILCNLRIKWL